MISAIVLTKNEEKNIQECLETLQWCDEIVIVDDYSEDGTMEKCQTANAKCQIYKRHLNGDFAAQRNFGLEKAKGEWVLFVDADERVSPQLRAEIQSVINHQQLASPTGGSVISGYYLKREDKIWGQTLRHGENARVKLLRLGKKGRGKWRRPIHEVWEIKGEIDELKTPLQHSPHQTISEFLEEINFYSTLRARELYQQGKRTNLREILAYPIAKFLQNYFLFLGILDGMPGFIVALFMSFHSFLVRSKLYLLWQHHQEKK